MSINKMNIIRRICLRSSSDTFSPYIPNTTSKICFKNIQDKEIKNIVLLMLKTRKDVKSISIGSFGSFRQSPFNCKYETIYVGDTGIDYYVDIGKYNNNKANIICLSLVLFIILEGFIVKKVIIKE